MRGSSFIAVDLSNGGTLAALESLERMTKRMSKIRSAFVFTSRAGVGIHPKIGTGGLQAIFSILAKMPNLKEVKIDLNRPHHYCGNGDLTIKALTNLLANTSGSPSRLQSVQFHQLDLYSDASASHTSSACTNKSVLSANCQSAAQDWKDFAAQLPKHKHWRGIEVVNCTGAGIGALMTVLSKHSKSLKSVKVVGTPMPNAVLSRFTARPQLVSLQLEDLPDITDCQVAQLAMNLEHPHCLLKELHVRSSLLTEAAGDALTDMLWANKSLKKLCLHLDCETLASGIAHCLIVNTTLQEVDLRCYGDDEAVTLSVKHVAEALQQNQSLRRLRLCLEIEFCDFEQDIVDAFAHALKYNRTLTELVLDDGIAKHPLPQDLKFQIQLNLTGYSQLIASNNQATSTNQWIDALATPDNDLNTLYTILRNSPTLFAPPVPEDLASSPSTTTKTVLVDTSSMMSDDMSSSSSSSKLRFRLPFRSRSNDSMPALKELASSNSSSSNSSKKSSTGSGSSGKSLRRKMMKILTPAA
ncbi:expressed unknown protein [Seminavis robusta]|uniref:Uncharacterized protein n=1 Tax=Seminavis robusta TaxID=568900 RepID=A0A9N8H407_9STRA|nr:expressed unknown protein [Seminavis robusta]|eukprot:Sro38_g023760.1 n/a (526) ;mRNA; r:89429-91006